MSYMEITYSVHIMVANIVPLEQCAMLFKIPYTVEAIHILIFIFVFQHVINVSQFIM